MGILTGVFIFVACVLISVFNYLMPLDYMRRPGIFASSASKGLAMIFAVISGIAAVVSGAVAYNMWLGVAIAAALLIYFRVSARIFYYREVRRNALDILQNVILKDSREPNRSASAEQKSLAHKLAVDHVERAISGAE